MKQDTLTLCIFIDALGAEVAKRHPAFLADLLPHRKKLDTILGYSSACDPSIISGLLPSQHLQWSSFYYSPKTCPYAWTKWLQLLPRSLTKYQRVRNRLTRLIKWVHGFTGYFQIYQFPFQYLPLFDYAEKTRIWGEEGLWNGKTIFNRLIEEGIPYYVGDQAGSESNQWKAVYNGIEDRSIRFAYLLLGQLDALMHAEGPMSENVPKLLRCYDSQIRRLYAAAKDQYDKVDLHLFSDHGMHHVREDVDLIAKVEALPLQFGKDYVAVYDSTMARYWFFNDRAKTQICETLAETEGGRIVASEELKELGVYFEDHLYGEVIFLLDSHKLIVPSFMGLNHLEGMHGYHPSDPDSAAFLASNKEIPDELVRIEQIYWLFLRDLELKADSSTAFVRPLDLLPESELPMSHSRH